MEDKVPMASLLLDAVDELLTNVSDESIDAAISLFDYEKSRSKLSDVMHIRQHDTRSSNSCELRDVDDRLPTDDLLKSSSIQDKLASLKSLRTLCNNHDVLRIKKVCDFLEKVETSKADQENQIPAESSQHTVLTSTMHKKRKLSTYLPVLGPTTQRRASDGGDRVSLNQSAINLQVVRQTADSELRAYLKWKKSRRTQLVDEPSRVRVAQSTVDRQLRAIRRSDARHHEPINDSAEFLKPSATFDTSLIDVYMEIPLHTSSSSTPAEE